LLHVPAENTLRLAKNVALVEAGLARNQPELDLERVVGRQFGMVVRGQGVRPI